MESPVVVIGLGIMGRPMAINLLKAGYDVTGFNRSPEKTQLFIDAGGKTADSLNDAVASAKTVITMLPDTPDVERVMFGDDGVMAHLQLGALFIDMSSIQPTCARALASAGSARGVDVLDAPVSGGEAGAINAALSIMVGGEDKAFERAKPIFEVLGTTIVHVGPAGSGQTVKAANQLIVAGNIELVAEAIVFLQAQGVDLPGAVEVLAGGLAGSTVLDRKATPMLDHAFAPGFRIDLHHKDLGICLSAAREVGAVLPLGAVVAQLMASARAQGHGSLDHSALLLGVEALSGLKE